MAQLILKSFTRTSRISCHSASRVFSSTYRSQYSIENLYPHAATTNSVASTSAKISDPNGKFTGYIPLDDLEITYSRSSGPGGQNVNKVNTKVEIRFHVEKAKWIPEKMKSTLLTKEAGRITRNGYFVMKSEKTRSQTLNQADCLDRLRQVVFSCDVEPYQPTPEELEIIKQRQLKAKAGILKEKRNHSMKKQTRQAPSSSDI